MSTQDNVWSEVAKTYTIHPETIAATALSPEFPSSNSSIEQVRNDWHESHVKMNGEDEFLFDGTSEDIDAGGVPATVYIPESRPAENPSIMVYFHGGSLMFCSRVTHERCLKNVAQLSGVVVVNVEYRLLPCQEDPMVPFKDAVTATQWVLKNRHGLCGVGGAGSKVGLGGDSAGGQLVLGVTNEIKSGLDFLVLVYPTADLNLDLPSCKEFATNPGFNSTRFRLRLEKTTESIPDAEMNPTLNAAIRTDISSLPPTIIVLAQLDPLRDAGKGLAERLKTSGVLVRLHTIEGVPHGFFSFPGVYKETTKQAFNFITDFLKKFSS